MSAKAEKRLNKPFRLPKGNSKKFGVYVKNDKGNIVLVRFGDPNMEIRRDNPEARKNFRSRHGCDNPGPKWKAKYWSCKMWSSKPVSSIASEDAFCDEEVIVEEELIEGIPEADDCEFSVAAVNYLNEELYKDVKEKANKKFGADTSYVKSLWILKTYKERGGKVRYSGKKPSKENIKKQVKAMVDLDFTLFSLMDEFEEV